MYILHKGIYYTVKYSEAPVQCKSILRVCDSTNHDCIAAIVNRRFYS